MIPIPPSARTQAESLWREHTPLAEQLVREYCFYQDHREDAAQEAQIGLWEACLAWQHDMEATFTQYAWMAMRKRLLTYLTSKAKDRPRLTPKEKEVMSKIREIMASGQMISCHAIDALSRVSGIRRYRLCQLIGFWYSASLKVTADAFGDLEAEPSSVEEEAEDSSRLELLHKGLESLSERQRYVIQLRFLSDPRATLAEIAADQCLSVERIRQIENQAIKKLKQAIANGN